MPQVVATSPADGLTRTEAAARARKGEANVVPGGSGRSYRTILRANVFSFYNVVLFSIGVVLIVMQRFSDAFLTVGIGLLNSVMGSVQEIRAKRKLDHLQLLDEQQVTVLRDGVDDEVAPRSVVRGDVVRIRAGAQIVVDGPLVAGGPVEIDESLLTGETDPVVKSVGDEMRSGSLCVGGEGLQVADRVGADSYAGRLTVAARTDTTDQTPMQRRIAFLVRLVMALVVLMSIAILAQALLDGFKLERIVQITAVLSGLVPYGLFFLIAIAYTAGAARISDDGALVQQVNAVESISNVDVVCTDKTGTLTTGRLTLRSVEVLDGRTADAVRSELAGFARSATSPNLTSSAIAAEIDGDAWRLLGEVPFTSALRWSGAVTADGAWVLGAPDALADHLVAAVPTETVDAFTAQGLRVLLFARAVDPSSTLHGGDGTPALDALRPLALVVLADELRPEVPDTIARFASNGVAVKVISGDDPRTVAALAGRAGLPAGRPVRGAELDGLDDAALDSLTAATSVFGRVAPEQKERIVASLRRQGSYVAMVGDGVNDARALKGAQVGVAMRSGSSVTRDVADVVLLQNSFAALLPARREGRRIIGGLSVSLYVFLTRVAVQGLVILTVSMLGLGFPYSPTQAGLTLLTVGLPTLFLTFWAAPEQPDSRLLGDLARFVLPASLVTAGFASAIYAAVFTAVRNGVFAAPGGSRAVTEYERYTGVAYGAVEASRAQATIGAQTAMSTFVCFASFILILFLRPPTRIFAAWTAPVADKRPAVLVAGLFVLFGAVLFIEPLSSYFGLTGPAIGVLLIGIVPALLLWFAALSVVLRSRVFERLLGFDRLPGRRPTGS